jgi:hypothetical protein
MDYERRRSNDEQWMIAFPMDYECRSSAVAVALVGKTLEGRWDRRHFHSMQPVLRNHLVRGCYCEGYPLQLVHVPVASVRQFWERKLLAWWKGYPSLMKPRAAVSDVRPLSARDMAVVETYQSYAGIVGSPPHRTSIVIGTHRQVPLQVCSTVLCGTCA